MNHRLLTNVCMEKNTLKQAQTAVYICVNVDMMNHFLLSSLDFDMSKLTIAPSLFSDCHFTATDYSKPKK